MWHMSADVHFYIHAYVAAISNFGINEQNICGRKGIMPKTGGDNTLLHA